MSTEAPAATSEGLALYRRAANYIAAAMIYLQGNHMLEEPLKPEHVKFRLLGHWGTVPGINLVYGALNRMILDHGQSTLLVTGPGHGAPANLANLWMEGALGEVRPDYTRDRQGLERLIHDFSWPGGFPSHLAPMVRRPPQSPQRVRQRVLVSSRHGDGVARGELGQNGMVARDACGPTRH